MSVEEVRTKVQEIIAAGNADPEGSHVDEDRLVWSVVREIAAGTDDPQGLASAVLPLADADLERWYA